MFVLSLAACVFACIIYIVIRRERLGFCRSRKRLDGKTCLVTGGTSGIGLEVSIDLAARGARVIVACPFQKEGSNALKRIIEETGNTNVVFKHLDLGNFRSAREFAKDILETEDRLDILMNNAGLSMGVHATSENDISEVLRVNYLGHFLLTTLLLPLLEKSGSPLSPSRIVNTISIMYWIARLDVEKLFMPNDSNNILYANSKLALVLMSRELTKRFPTPNVVINNADPGEVGTMIYFNGVSFMSWLSFFTARLTGKSPYMGSQTLLHAALDKKAGQSSGVVYRNCIPVKPPSIVNNLDIARKLWDKSLIVVNNLNHQEFNNKKEHA